MFNAVYSSNTELIMHEQVGTQIKTNGSKSVHMAVPIALKVDLNKVIFILPN